MLVSERTNDVAKEAGILAVKAAYANSDSEMVLSLLNDTPEHIRKSFATWFAAYGVAVVKPEYGKAEYTLAEGIVKDKKRQAKVFAAFATGDVLDVLKQEIAVRVQKKVKPLVGTPQARAAKRIESLIKSLKTTDPETAGYIGETWAMKVVETDLGFEDGTEFTLNAAEEAKVKNFIMTLRGDMRKAA